MNYWRNDYKRAYAKRIVARASNVSDIVQFTLRDVF